MVEKLEKVKELLKEQKQEQLLNCMGSPKEELLDSILSINFEQLNELYKKAIQKQKEIKRNIEPICCIKKDSLTHKQEENYKKIGENLIKQGKYCVITMAGGQRNKIGT